MKTTRALVLLAVLGGGRLFLGCDEDDGEDVPPDAGFDASRADATGDRAAPEAGRDTGVPDAPQDRTPPSPGDADADADATTGAGDAAPDAPAAEECTFDDGGARCDPLTTCTEADASIVCSPCPTGHAGTGLAGCVEVDECATGKPGGGAACDPLTTCSNTPAGSWSCSACPGGYTGDGRIGCTVIPSVVTISATDGDVAEPANGGTFTVSRGAATSPAITVRLAVGAASTVTSVAGTFPRDYDLGGAGVSAAPGGVDVTFPDGVSARTVTVTPVANTHAEHAEILVLGLSGGAGYSVGGAASATATFAAHGLDVLVTTDSASPAALEGTLRQALTNAIVTGGTINVPAGTISLVAALPLLENAAPITVSGPLVGQTVWSCATGSGLFETHGTLTIERVVIQNCSATIGGAIFNRGALTVSGSTFQNNTATARGAAIANFVAGGNPSVTITGSTFANNTGAEAIDNGNGTLTVGGSVFLGNTAGDISGSCTNGGAPNVPVTTCP